MWTRRGTAARSAWCRRWGGALTSPHGAAFPGPSPGCMLAARVSSALQAQTAYAHAAFASLKLPLRAMHACMCLLTLRRWPCPMPPSSPSHAALAGQHARPTCGTCMHAGAAPVWHERGGQHCVRQRVGEPGAGGGCGECRQRTRLHQQPTKGEAACAMATAPAICVAAVLGAAVCGALTAGLCREFCGCFAAVWWIGFERCGRAPHCVAGL